MRCPRTTEEIAEIRALHTAGVGICEIARRTGLTRKGVAYHVRPDLRERMQRRAREFQQSMKEAANA